MREIIYTTTIALTLLGCGSGTNSTNTTLSFDNSSIEDNTSIDNPILEDHQILKTGKAQLGVLADATVNIYEFDGVNRELISTEQTSNGDTIETIGNFDINVNKLNSDRFYIYEVVGGTEDDVNDDGIIDKYPISNEGKFHFIGKGSDIKSSDKLNITIVTEVVYQNVIDDIDGNSDKKRKERRKREKEQ